MDPEPGRCRRTDGKKWRCSRDVFPDQKYCERHMHRGRLRSRKHVEFTEKATKSKSPKTGNSNKTTISIKPPDSAKKMSNSSTQLPAILKPIHHPSSSASSKVCSAATSVSISPAIVYSRKNCNVNAKNDSSVGSTTYITTYSDSNESLKIKRSSKNILSNSKCSTVAPGSDIPPKGVRQSGVGCDTSTGVLTETPHTETEPQRCRRTDGRKWRCSSDVLPDQKYCLQHMHRGVKKLMAAANPMPITSFFPPLPTIPTNLNTGIIITPLSTHRAAITYDETSSTSGSSSDATTIMDDDENTSDSSKYIIKPRSSNIQTPF